MISVIIPIYNVEKYLNQCLFSVINQTYSDLEIILINDGSTDGSSEICKKFAKIDARIKIINKKNSGAASARNTGLDIVKGDYISFVDSDDYLSLDYYEIMMKNMNDVDIVECNEYIFSQNSIDEALSIDSGIYNNIEFMEIYLDNWSCALIHNKLFKKSVVKHYFFESNVIDDEYFTYKCILASKTIKHIDDRIYYYRLRKSSLMRNKDTLQLQNIDKIDFMFKRYQDLKSIPEIREKSFKKLIDNYCYILNGAYVTEENIREIKYKFIKLLFECRKLVHFKTIILVLMKRKNNFLDKNKYKQKVDEEDYYE